MDSISDILLDDLSQPNLNQAQFETYKTARQKIVARLGTYQSLNDDDDTVYFLRAVFRFLPTQGQVQLADDASDCNDDDEIRELASHLDTYLLWPMIATCGTTPPLETEGSMENILSRDLNLAARRLSVSRRICLQRDNHQCVVTKAWDTNHSHRPSAALTTHLDAVHILPFSLESHRDDERQEYFRVWRCLRRYFPNIHEFSPPGRIDNIISMASALHRDFSTFAFVLEQTQVPNSYRVKTFPRFQTFHLRFVPAFITIASHPQYDSPSRNLLAVHAAVGNILHATGRDERIKERMHLRHNGTDGTNVEDLSLSDLSLVEI
ncbi:hypothetical protein BDV28DRAFT_131886 [Aspergillus coremiiformis]|uniref:HNH nuclease domain-containing protein n=1 Tax=Aspergillus coremiiformis TaxID=138285 RepID=A0A5N6Z8N7_9EURO|nr:hypothetical protein BDV28DRAFT_131886 [Aspergillus coremiiformis]